jgi:nitroreductase
METWRAINTLRVVRKFEDRPLAAEHLDRILNAGRRTGSSKNEQRWAFIVATEPDHLRELASVGGYADHLGGAAAAIALVVPAASDPLRGISVMWDLGRAAQNMVLAAWELGIGSCPATVYNQHLVRPMLGLPGDQRCDFILSFGYPANPAKLNAPNRPGGRKPLEAVVHKERW